MKYKFIVSADFQKSFKKIFKKHQSLKDDIRILKEELEQNPKIGESLGHDCYKVRLAIKSKNKGKSGGARIITCVKIVKETIYLLSIYDKSDQENISDKKLQNLLKNADL